MPKHHHDPGRKLYEEVQARQRNTTWPDAMKNSRGVDDLLWNGSPNPTRVQRAGILIFGISYIVAGAALMTLASEQHTKILGCFSLLPISIGVKVTYNAFFKRVLTRKNRHPHRIPTDPQ